MLYTAVMHEEGPVAIRYPRGAGRGLPLKPGSTPSRSARPCSKAGEGHRCARDRRHVVPSAIAADALAAKGIDAEVVNMRFVKPLDADMLRSVVARFHEGLTVEHNTCSADLEVRSASSSCPRGERGGDAAPWTSRPVC